MKRLVVPRVENTGSSNSGAGSSNFHTYRRDRNAERKRVEGMEQAHAEDEADRAFKKRRADANAACEEKTKKRAAKRRRKKQNQRAARKRGKTGGGGEAEGWRSGVGGGGGSGSAKSVGIGQNALPNNGTALQKLLAMQAKPGGSGGEDSESGRRADR